MVEITVEDGVVIRVDGLPPGYGFRVSDDGERGDDGEHASQEPTTPPGGPFGVWLVWGERPESADAITYYEYSSEELLNAFLHGVDEASGWLDSYQAESEEDAKRYLREEHSVVIPEEETTDETVSDD
jgi:hypothetical protein